MIDLKVVKTALESFEESFSSDGAKIEVASIEGSKVNIKVIVFPGGCRECILPAEDIAEMFKNSIEEEAGEDAEVHVEIEDRTQGH